MQTVLQVDGLELHRPGGFSVRLPALQLGRGEVAALYGPSGVGKTTLLETMFDLRRGGTASVAGRVRVLDRSFEPGRGRAAELRHTLRHDVAWVAQDGASALDPLLAVGRQIEQATAASGRAAAAALTGLGVADAERVATRLPHEISGGQAQRVLLATAALRRPALVVADEPTANLDEASAAEVVAQFDRLRRDGTAILLATHDRRLLQDLDATVFVPSDGTFAPGVAAAPAWPQRSPDDVAASVTVLAAHGVAVRLGGRTVLDGVDLELRRGEIVALVGPSGIGKTTLLRVLAGHLAPDRGEVHRPGGARSVQLVFQDAFAALTPGRTLRSLLAEARAPGFDPVAAADGLALPEPVLDRTAAAMSGGERRRAALLRALAVGPAVLLLDEPTAALDRPAAIAVVESLLALRRERDIALLIVTHDRSLAAAVAHRTVTLHEGKACSSL